MPGSAKLSQVRAKVARRAGYRCEYCLCPSRYSPDPFSVEHVRPKALGGGATLSNLALACQGCNGYKHKKIQSIDPVTRELVALYNPRVDAWTDHFTWDESYGTVIGITPVGRATVE